ncbi:hypothetical protein Ancab_013056 [Ancistrocladus abbreviatus]
MNVELNNIQDFDVVPEECTRYVGKYMMSTQYKVDIERAVEECIVYLSSRCPLKSDGDGSSQCSLKRDGKDAWIFDIDDTLLSTVPYFKKHNYGEEKLNLTSLEEWKSQSKAPAIKQTLNLFNEIKSRGIQIILLSSRREHLRSATVDNLLDVGFHGWSSLILRSPEDEDKQVQIYKAEIRKQLIVNGYQIWGVMGDQWSSLQGYPGPGRKFKLPNPLYYVS